jgi:hypothetical protein
VTKVKPPSESSALCRTSELFATSKYTVAPASVFPAQSVEFTDCGDGTMDPSSGPGPPSACRTRTHSSGVCCSASVKVKLPAGRLFVGQFSDDEPEQPATQNATAAMH